MIRRSNILALLSLVLLLAIVYGVRYLADAPGGAAAPAGVPAPGSVAAPEVPAGSDEAAILEAFAERRSGLVFESAGVVARILPDDDEGSRHQRFILRLPSGHTLLVSHNIDLAPRVPLDEGDRVAFRGQYEWNERGGVIHWTHHDPGGRRPGGWIRHGSRTYR